MSVRELIKQLLELKNLETNIALAYEDKYGTTPCGYKLFHIKEIQNDDYLNRIVFENEREKDVVLKGKGKKNE